MHSRKFIPKVIYDFNSVDSIEFFPLILPQVPFCTAFHH